MKIAQLVCVYPPYRGGIGNAAKNFALLAKNHGHDSTVITPSYKKDDYSPDSCKVERLKPFLKYGNAALLPQLIFRLGKFDVVHFHYPFFGADVFVWLAKIFFGKRFRLIIHYHMDVVGLPLLLRPLMWPSRIIFESLIRKAESVTCASFDYLKNSLIHDIFEKYQDKFREIPFGVDIGRFKPDYASRQDNNIIFIGGLDSAHYFKGLDFLIRTLAAIKDLDWNLDIVGSGNLMPDYEKLVSKSGLEGRVNFLGGLNDEALPKAYNRSSFLVLSAINRNEAFGLVLLEALACGIPVVASRLPGVRSVFSEGIEGLLFETGNAVDLERKIRLMLENTAKASEMGEAGRRLVLEKYDWNIIGNKLNELIEKQDNAS